MPREISAIAIAGVLLCSREMKTRDILGQVDWHLVTLFCALFVVIRGAEGTGGEGGWSARCGSGGGGKVSDARRFGKEAPPGAAAGRRRPELAVG